MQNGEDIFRDKNDDFSNGGSSFSFNSGVDRVNAIEEIFQKVLGRKPTSREISFYKYGVIPVKDIQEKLLDSDEHKKLIEDAKKLHSVEEQLLDTQIDIKKLNQKIKDLIDENIEQKNLLEEKNRIIEGLRVELENPYDLPTQIEKFEEGFDTYGRIGAKYEGPKTFVERFRDILDRILH